jgi:hypothetical protein
VLYEMLTTRRPHHRGASAPSGANARVPPELDAVVLKALSPNPASRYQSAVVLAGELRAVAAMLDARDLSDDDTPASPSSSKLVPVLAAGGLLLAAGVALVWWLSTGMTLRGQDSGFRIQDSGFRAVPGIRS